MSVATEIAAARAQATQALPEECAIRRRPAPGQVRVTVSGSVPCRLRMASGGDPERASGVAADLDLTGLLRVPVGTDIRRHDLAVLDGRTLEVLALMSGPRLHLSALVRAESG